jgi:hypothetical protein
MPKIIPVLLLIGIVFSMAFSPVDLGKVVSAAATPTPTAEISADLPEGMELWCLPEGVAFPKDPAEITKGTLAISIEYSDGFVLNGPFSGCFVQVPAETQYEDAKIAIFDQSNSSAWYTRNLVKNGDGLIAVLTHSYIVNPPMWHARYRLEIQSADGTVLFSTPLLYQRKWQAERCWNGNMPNPTTLRCPLQQDLHPWDTGYGKPLPTLKPTNN